MPGNGWECSLDGLSIRELDRGFILGWGKVYFAYIYNMWIGIAWYMA
jgi:hypothetical protein